MATWLVNYRNSEGFVFQDEVVANSASDAEQSLASSSTEPVFVYTGSTELCED